LITTVLKRLFCQRCKGNVRKEEEEVKGGEIKSVDVAGWGDRKFT
jgi:hypothetical protein